MRWGLNQEGVCEDGQRGQESEDGGVDCELDHEHHVAHPIRVRQHKLQEKEAIRSKRL
jgi:hypothetical protein